MRNAGSWCLIGAVALTGCGARTVATGSDGGSGDGGTTAEDTQTDPGESGGTTGTSGGTATTGGSSCGDGNVDPGEDCDDGNDVQGDGCNNDCVPSGTELWTRTYDGDGDHDYGYGVATDGEDNVLLAGYTVVGTDFDVWVRKYDAAGAELWTRTSDGGQGDFGLGIATDRGDNVLVTGSTEVGNIDNIWVRKYDAAGAEVWTRTFDSGSGDDRGYGVAADGANDVLVTGYTRGSGDNDAWVRKYDAAGAELWTRGFDSGLSHDHGRDIASDGADNVIVVGDVHNGTNSDIWVCKYDAAGAELWTRTFDGGSGYDYGDGVATDGADNVLVAGYTQNDAGYDIWVRKYDAAGAEVWTRTLDGGSGNDFAYGAAVDGADNLVVAGSVRDGMDGDMWVRKYDAAGTELWTRTFDGGHDDSSYGVATDGVDNVVVAGTMWSALGSSIWVRKYTP